MVLCLFVFLQFFLRCLLFYLFNVPAFIALFASKVSIYQLKCADFNRKMRLTTH